MSLQAGSCVRKLLTFSILYTALSLPSWAVRGGEERGAHRIVTPRRSSAAAPALSAEQKAALRQAESEGVEVTLRPGWSTRISVRDAQLGGRRSFSGGQGLRVKGRGDYGEDAVAVLDNLSRVIGIRRAGNEFKPRRVSSDRFGYHHVRMKQMHEGLRVVGGDLIVHFDENDDAYQVNGSYVPGIGVDTEPVLDAGTAVQIVRKDVQGLGLSVSQMKGTPELVVYARQGSPVLAYELSVATRPDSGQVPGFWRYWVDAVSGTLICRYNDLKDIAPPGASGQDKDITGSILVGEGGGLKHVQGWYDNGTVSHYLYNKNRKWYVFNDSADAVYPDPLTYAWRATSNWDDPDQDRAEMSAAVNFDATQSYYQNVHGRNSYDNAGTYAVANVHVGDNYGNAYWSPGDQQFFFGDGGGYTDYDSLVVMDVVAHEFTHAVTEKTADLIYAYESGALNESFSDIFGACVEFYAQQDGRGSYPNAPAGKADWLMGEDCWVGGGVAMRDMSDPDSFQTLGYDGDFQPSRYFGDYWYTGDGDNGGVHYNSGVQNFFFYLLCEGGSGNNDGIPYNISGISITNAEQVAYRTLTVYCTPSTDYRAVRNAWMSAAADLNPAWAAVVDAAWKACGIGEVDIQPNASVVFEGKQGGIFLPWKHTYTLTNYSDSAITWSLSHSEPWLRVIPAGGTLAAGGSETLELMLTDDAKALGEDIYTDVIDVTSSSGYLLGSRSVNLWVGQPDHFSEQFTYGDTFDLGGLSITFTPDGSASWYSADAKPITALPVDPSSHALFSLSDDQTAATTQFTGGALVKLYNQTYNRLFIGSNGYITFGAGDRDYSESFDEHFEMPRISMLYDDLNPASGGEIRWAQLSDRVVVSFIAVPEFGGYNPNTFQTELFFNGVIRMSWLDVNAYDGLVGLSKGEGLPDFFKESDLSAFGWDYDDDGIPNWWELEYFSGNTNCVATHDTDGDGQNNLEEFIAGMNPQSTSSVFAVTRQYPLEEGGDLKYVVEWDVIEGREYSIWRGYDIMLGFDEIASGISYPVNAFTDNVEYAEAQNFYKVEVKLIE